MSHHGTTRNAVALIAHDARKSELVAFALRHRSILLRYPLMATATTGRLLNGVLGGVVECKLSGPLGGDAQIAAEVASKGVCAVIFLIDPLSAPAHWTDIFGLLRICNVHDVPVATNPSTAEVLVQALEHDRLGPSPQEGARRAAPDSASKSRPITGPHDAPKSHPFGAPPSLIA
jgi:methylglyoxal synthase